MMGFLLLCFAIVAWFFGVMVESRRSGTMVEGDGEPTAEALAARQGAHPARVSRTVMTGTMPPDGRRVEGGTGRPVRAEMPTLAHGGRGRARALIRAPGGLESRQRDKGQGLMFDKRTQQELMIKLGVWQALR